MAAPVVVYFAGIGTVVAALGIGFGSALMLVSTQPVHKEPPAAFAKREQLLAVEQPPVVTAPAQTTEPANAMAGLVPPMTALPIPKADEVSQAIAKNPPPAVTALVGGPAPVQTAAPTSVQTAPVQAQTPARPPTETSASKVQSTNDSKVQSTNDIVAPQKKPERKIADRKPLVMADKRRPVEVETSQEDSPPEASQSAPQSERPLRSGF